MHIKQAYEIWSPYVACSSLLQVLRLSFCFDISVLHSRGNLAFETVLEKANLAESTVFSRAVRTNIASTDRNKSKTVFTNLVTQRTVSESLDTELCHHSFCNNGRQRASSDKNLLQAADVILVQEATTKHLEGKRWELEHHANLEQGVHTLLKTQ